MPFVVYLFKYIFQSTITLDGNKLVHKQVGDKEKKEKDSELLREFTDDKMLMVRFQIW